MPSGCVSDDEFSDFFEGRLTPERLSALESHLETCEACTQRMLVRAREHHALVGLAPEGGLLARGSTVARFVVLEVLGRGAFGTVYAAYDPQLDRRLALKVLDAWASGEDERRARVEREARNLARVTHPNVVAVHDTGTAQGLAWVAMEYVDGQSFTQWLETPRSVVEIVDVLAQAGRGLAAIHAAGVVHGDFRADNVLVGGGRVLVTDFGLARLADQSNGGQWSTQKDQLDFARVLQRSVAKGTGAIPRRVQRVLARALSDRPFPELEELLAALEPPRRWPLLAAAALALVAMAGALTAPSACAPDDAGLVGVWGAAEHDALLARFEGQPPWARDSGRLVSDGLDRWRQRWLDTSVKVCAAQRTSRSPSDAELQRACLADSRREVLTMVGALRDADGALVRRAQQVAVQLASPERCADSVSLRNEPLPSDATRRAAFLTLRERLVEGRNLRELGRLKEARPVLEKALASARGDKLGSLVARAAFELGATVGRLGEHALAVELLEEALHAGLEERADEPSAHAAVLLVYERGVTLGEAAAGAELAQLADALVRRIGDERLAAGLLTNRALLAESRGAFDEALRFHRSAVEAFERVAPSSSALANALQNLGRVLAQHGSLAEARTTLERATELLVRVREPGHPNVGVAFSVLATIALEQGRYDDADELALRARTIGESAFGAAHLEVFQADDVLTRAALGRGEVPLAVTRAEKLTAPADCGERALQRAVTLAELELAQGRAPMLEVLARCPDAKPDALTNARIAWLRAQTSVADRRHWLEEAARLARPDSVLAARARDALASASKK